MPVVPNPFLKVPQAPGVMQQPGFWAKPAAPAGTNPDILKLLQNTSMPHGIGETVFQKPTMAPTGPPPSGGGNPLAIGGNIQDILAALNQQGGAGSSSGSMGTQASLGYSGPSAQEMAASEFGPQYDALQKIVAQARDRYNGANADVGNMYSALSAQQKGQSAGITSQYDSTGKKINGGYANVANQTAGHVADNQRQVTEMLKRLGIEQAAPQALGSQSKELASMLGDLAGRQTAAGQFNTQQGQNEVDYNNRNADTTALAGKNQQSLLMQHWLDQQQGFDQQNLQLHSGEAAAANKYGLSIQDLLATQQKNAFDQNSKMQNDQYKQAQMDLDLAKFKQQTQNDNNAADLNANKALQSSGDAYSIIANKASDLYGAGSPQAGDALDTIIRAYQTMNNDAHGDPTATPDLSKLISYATFGQNSDADKARLAQLASLWWTKIGNKPGTSQYGPSTN